MICVPRCIQPSHKCTFTASNIEVACSRLTLPNGNKMQICVLYRSPNAPLQALLTTLSQVLLFASNAALPTVILGDFNVDILSQPNSNVVKLMLDHGYTQLVTHPTTSNCTLLDHVYYNQPSSDIIVQVCDKYLLSIAPYPYKYIKPKKWTLIVLLFVLRSHVYC